MKSYSPLRYPGGKGRTYKYIKNLVEINGCKNYIEPYAGGAGVALSLLINNDVEKIFINDYDRAIYSFWYSVINNSEELIEYIESKEITMDEWYRQKEIYLQKDKYENLIELAFATLFLNRTNRSGILKAGVIGGKKQDGKYKLDCRFNKSDICNRIKEISNRKKDIYVYNLDAEEFIKKTIVRTKNSLTFFDPPYYEKGPALYTNFYTHKNHEDLSKTIKKYMVNKKWIITYDNSHEIFSMYKEFRYERYHLNYSISKPSKGVEYIFFSDNLIQGEISNFLNLIEK